MNFEFTPTRLELYQACPRKYYLKEVLHLVPKAHNIALGFGSTFHAARAAYYQALLDKQPYDLAVVIAAQTFTKQWESLNLVGDSKRSLPIGLILLNEYCKQNQNPSYPPTHLEVEQRISFPNGSTLIGHLDDVHVGKLVILRDCKTTSLALTDWYFRQYLNSFQITAYYRILCEIFGRCDEVVIDAIQTPPPKERANACQKRSYFRTDLQVADWENTYFHITDELMEFLSTPEPDVRNFPQFQVSCVDYGQCPYLNICLNGLDDPSVQMDFVKEEIAEEK